MAEEEKALEGILVGFTTIDEELGNPDVLSLLVKTDDNELIYGYHAVDSKLFDSYRKVLKEGQRIKLWGRNNKNYENIQILSEPISTQPQ